MLASSSNTSTNNQQTNIKKRDQQLSQSLKEIVSATTKKQQLNYKTTKQQSNRNTETMLLNNVISSDITYNANAAGQGSVRRIRTPSPHDVLSGRGGSVNAHPGNCQFRDWVHLRKEEYNLARSKQAKAEICRTIISKVMALGGRFLAKESPNSQWWIEQDDERMMSKTSQALREGAPKIREAHRDELGLSEKASSSRRKSRVTSNKQSSSGQQQHSFSNHKRPFTNVSKSDNASEFTDGKRVRVDLIGQAVYPNQPTPVLSSVSEHSVHQIPSNDFQDFQLIHAQSTTQRQEKQPQPQPMRFPPPLSRAPLSNYGVPAKSNFYRSNSLATSDINAEEIYDFVNPFDDESFLNDIGSGESNKIENSEPISKASNERTLSDSSSSSRNSFVMGTKFVKPGLWRETSVSSTTTDLAGFGALIGGGTDSSSYVTAMDTIPTTTAPASTAHIVPMRSTSMGSTSTAENLYYYNNRNDTTRPNGKHLNYFDDNNNKYDNIDDDDYDDNRSVTSEATIGLPVWDWFNRDEPYKSSTSSSSLTTFSSSHPIPISLQ